LFAASSAQPGSWPPWQLRFGPPGRDTKGMQASSELVQSLKQQEVLEIVQ
jgi:hypothetical protein